MHPDPTTPEPRDPRERAPETELDEEALDQVSGGFLNDGSGDVPTTPPPGPKHPGGGQGSMSLW